jgi:hypothetical protein
MKTAVLWDVAPCNLVDVYRLFRCACCLHRPGDGPKDSHLHTRRRENLKSHLDPRFEASRLNPEMATIIVRRF